VGAARLASILACAAALAALLLASRLARAEGPSPSLDGAWVMAPLTETFTVQQWSSACGPAPTSGTLSGGGQVAVRGEGGELVVTGGSRTLRTDQCIDPLPTLARETHSSSGNAWRTRCATPTSDPRRAVINTAYFLTGDDAIVVAETGRYEFRIKDSRCIADVKRDGSLRKVVAAPVATQPPPEVAPATATAPALAPAPSPAPPPSPATADCGAPGDPARLEVRPSRKLVRVGNVFAFRAVVLDDRGCVTSTPIQWSVGAVKFKDGQGHAGQPLVDGGGKLTVPADMADATFDVIATAAGRSAHASVDATSPASYEALLAQSGLDPNGERGEPSVTILATTSIGASNVRAEDDARRRRTVFIVVVGGLALALGALAVIGTLRSRKARSLELAAEARHSEKMREYEQKKRSREEEHAAQMRAHLESVAQAQRAGAGAAAAIGTDATGVDTGPMWCPSCRREFSSGTMFCPFDANRLVAVSGHENLMAGPGGGVCPTCKRGFNPGVKICPDDGDELVPAAALAPQPPAIRGKICPTCGGRFEGAAAFCGKDGTQLVLLN